MQRFVISSESNFYSAQYRPSATPAPLLTWIRLNSSTHLIKFWWPLGDHLRTTWWPIGKTTWWPLGDRLRTTWWPNASKMSNQYGKSFHQMNYRQPFAQMSAVFGNCIKASVQGKFIKQYIFCKRAFYSKIKYIYSLKVFICIRTWFSLIEEISGININVLAATNSLPRKNLIRKKVLPCSLCSIVSMENKQETAGKQ